MRDVGDDEMMMIGNILPVESMSEIVDRMTVNDRRTSFPSLDLRIYHNLVRISKENEIYRYTNLSSVWVPSQEHCRS